MPGQPVEISWTLRGPVHRIGRFVICLEGREEATYRRGTSSYTDKETFFRMPLADTGRLPTLIECASSPRLLAGLIAELSDQPFDAESLWLRHRGNIRLALRSLYDMQFLLPVAFAVLP